MVTPLPTRPKPSTSSLGNVVSDSIPESGRFADVVVITRLGQAGGLFTYRIPEHLSEKVKPGCLVTVSFRNRELQGLVWSLQSSTDLTHVLDIADSPLSEPALHPAQLKLAAWMSDYYRAPLSDVIGAMLPKFSRSPTKPRIAHLVSLTEAGIKSLAGDALSRAPRQRDALEAVARLASATGRPVPKDEILRSGPGARGVLQALVAKGLITIMKGEVRDEPAPPQRAEPTTALRPSPAQQRALSEIATAITSGDPHIFLLHGVTGSGKTEVYLQAIARTLATGKQALMLVPEISLTPQAIERVSARFPGRIAVLHSELSERERLEAWQRIRSGLATIVVGPRSALFAPVPSPGLIIVDEEHDGSYKQDSSPRYNARDVAAVYGRLSAATVLFGSATPDVGTYQAALAGRIRLIELPDRPTWKATLDAESGTRPMPRVEIVDMRQELKSGNRGIFSNLLLEEMDQTLASRQQILLFLNRRGNATVVLCRDCGHVEHCPGCDVPFTYHSAGSILMCHRCNRRQASPKACAECGGRRIRYLGVGTQRVEEEVARQFPKARVIRWDRDITSQRGAHERILRAFAEHEADVMVGTQMIAKGLDFPLVTLVGVVSADTALHFPDFRSAERSFQLLTQVAGRAGRSSLPSRVVVQTYTPEHYAIQTAKKHDYQTFFRQELGFRSAAGYPPFARLVRFVRSSEDLEKCRTSSYELRQMLELAIKEERLDGAELIGPAPCFASRVERRYYWQLLLRAPPPASHLPKVLAHVPADWVIDVDPTDVL